MLAEELKNASTAGLGHDHNQTPVDQTQHNHVACLHRPSRIDAAVAATVGNDLAFFVPSP
jgi:hypothetical protein